MPSAAFFSENGVEIGSGWLKSQANVVYALSGIISASACRGVVRLLGIPLSAHPHVEIWFANGDGLVLNAENLEQAERMREAIARGMAPQSSPGLSVADELSKLSALRDIGALTDSDWERAKDLYLGKQPSEREASIEQLQQLHGLLRSGVLSESEFNMKKWDVLARQR